MDTANEFDDLDRRLREAIPYIDDAGFTRQVLAALPSPGARRQRLRAIILLGTTLLASVIAYVLSGGGRFVSQGMIELMQLGPLGVLYLVAAFGVLATGVGVVAMFSRENVCVPAPG